MSRKNKETKVVIFGDYNSGKTTTLDNLCEKKVKVEYQGTTISLDYGNTMVNGKKVHLFASPGQERFQFMREILYNGIDAAIVVVDVSQGISSREKKIMEHLELNKVPYVVFANKQDLGLKELNLDSALNIIPTIALQGKGLQQGLETLLSML